MSDTGDRIDGRCCSEEEISMIGAKLGHILDRPLAPVARILRTISPNAISLLGFFVNIAAAIVLARDLLVGGVLILVGGVLDIMDGVVARTNGKATEFGAYLDSVLDRYSDAFLFFGIAWYFRALGDITGVLLSLGSLLGAFGVSYARARAEGLGKSCKTGLMERPERIALLVFGALTGWMRPVLLVMFVLTHFTVIQRVFYVRGQCRR